MGRILAIRGGAVGDFILTLPALNLLKTGLPDAHVEVLGYEGVASLAVLGGMADEVRSIEHGTLANFFIPNSRLDLEFRTWLDSFDLAVSWLYDPDGIFAENLERCGIPTLLKGPHRMDENGAVPAAVQLAQPLEEVALFLETPWVDLGLKAEREPLVAIHPGSGSPSKNWGFENWIRLLRQIHEARPDLRFLILSGEAEMQQIGVFLAELEKAEIPNEHLQAAPLPEVAQRLAACQLFIGHDSGISHLAGVCGTPAEVIFGPTNPEIWAPQNPQVRVIASPEKRLSTICPDLVTTRALERLQG